MRESSSQLPFGIRGAVLSARLHREIDARSSGFVFMNLRIANCGFTWAGTQCSMQYA
jgi:hypothetical protein